MRQEPRANSLCPRATLSCTVIPMNSAFIICFKNGRCGLHMVDNGQIQDVKDKNEETEYLSKNDNKNDE